MMSNQTGLSIDNGMDGMMKSISDSNLALKELANKPINEKIRYRSPGSTLSIELKNFYSLNGEIEGRFSNLSDGSIVTLFDKTPHPNSSGDVVCPHFVELKWANGCNFDCAWCYLNGTMRFRPGGKKPYMKDRKKMIKHIETYLEQNDIPSLLNSGELSDSLVFEGDGYALSKTIIPLFKRQQTHKLLILTKSANIKGILASNSQDHVIVSFSINSFTAAKRWETKAPGPKQRIKAAKRLSDAGYTIRMRIDPIVPVDDWENDYRELIDFLFDHLEPERITIGSLRGLQSTINNSEDRSWVNYLDDTSNWGKKIGFKTRLKMYKTVINHLKTQYQYSNIGLCKETIEMWEKLGMDYKNIKCNCIL